MYIGYIYIYIYIHTHTHTHTHIYIYIRSVTVHKIHGSVQYDTVVSRFGMFSIRGVRGNWLRRNVGNISVLNHEGEPMDVQTLRNIYAGERLNLSQFTISRK